MAQPDITETFNTIVEPMRVDLNTTDIRLELAAFDPRIRNLAMQAVNSWEEGGYSSKEAENIMHDYGLAPWDIESAILRSISKGDVSPETRIKIAEAVTDSKVNFSLRCLINDGIKDEMILEDCYDELSKYISETYGLSAVLSSVVVGRCEQYLREDKNRYGEA